MCSEAWAHHSLTSTLGLNSPDLNRGALLLIFDDSHVVRV
jgi:hypothetical protein